jgi:hypothetical protein
MIGFSLEFKRWYLVLRGPKGRVYSAVGFAKQMPVFTPTHTMTLQEYMDDYHRFDTCIDDSFSAILADEWREDETDEDLLDQLKSIR